jgi:hypothetical protein
MSAFLVDHDNIDDNPGSTVAGFAINSVIFGGGGAALETVTA